ncbi:UDP-2,3-diacylglucosamine diphosphatase [Photobacterium sp. OFAV2-7]|uniref:UDP-2,3-diacylglucosamine diphosphatase n=1 Tax=Photobacterium sp. OFAV2-7 TaxID=2917748 RepID=UPI001EF521E3|nr:UDP-2,3-diacylglucosamine diphosphatase [Photobacterium sp. OFAV2-7]MCG7585784.1 UDP-2,3-diacylglucosamine diphosphatase [Photobacterium sp. OFAV2-7]
MHYNAIWLSDIHLGFRDCKAEYLLNLLNNTQCDTLYLVGDIIDFEMMNRTIHWPESHQEVLRKIINIASGDTRVVYIPGNHDYQVREFIGNILLNVEILSRLVHTNADGRQYLVTHGDEFDHAVLCSRFLKMVGDASYYQLLRLNRVINRVRKCLGLPYWSLAYYVKNRVGNARKAIEHYEQAAAQEAVRQGLDGIICGHLHQPELRTINGVLYCNDGDWVESCTALVEHRQGRLELVHWADIKQPIKCDSAANDKAYCAPYPLPPLQKPARKQS